MTWTSPSLRPAALAILVSVAVALAELGAHKAQAQDPFASKAETARDLRAPQRTQTRFVVETFQMPLAAGVELVTQNLPGKNMRNRVLAEIKAGTASLTKLMVLRSRDGARATLSQTDQYLYPTEFDPPQVPQILALVDPGRRPAASPQSPPTPTSPLPGTLVRSPFNGGLGILTTTTPTAFEMVALGEVLTLEAGWGMPLTLDFNLESRELVSEHAYGDIPSPVFSPKTMKHSLRLVSGDPSFIGSRSTPERKGVPGAAEKTLQLTFVTPKRETLPAHESLVENPFRRFHASVRSTLEVISVDKATAHGLMLEQPADAALHARLTTLVDQQQARRETVLAARSSPGEKVSAESADKYVWPTEFDPPQIPQQLILANHELLQDLRAGRQTGAGERPKQAGGNLHGGFGLITTLSPTAFEVTSTGEHLEIEVNQADEEFDASLAITFRRLSGTIAYNGIPHPVFEEQSLNTEVHLRPGEPTLLGTLNKPLNTGWKDTNKEDRIWLAFLRVAPK